MQPAGQQPRFDFHQPPIHRTDDVIPFLGRQILRIRIRQRHILIQIHQPRLIDDRIDDRHPAPGILQGLVGPDQLVQLLQPLIQPRILRRGGEVGNRLGVTATLGNRRLAGIVRRVVIEVGNAANQVIGIAISRHPHLFPRHELQRPVGAEVQHRIRLPNLLQIGVEGRKSVVGAGGTGKQQPHRIALVPERRLHPDKQVAKRLPVHQQILPVGVQMARRFPPTLVQPFVIRGEALVLHFRHPVRHVQLRTGILGRGIVNHLLHQRLRRLRQIPHVVAVPLQGHHHFVDTAEHVEIRRRPYIALIRGETENRNRQLLIQLRLPAQRCPLHRPFGHRFHPVLQGDRFSRHSIAA